VLPAKLVSLACNEEQNNATTAPARKEQDTTGSHDSFSNENNEVCPVFQTEEWRIEGKIYLDEFFGLVPITGTTS
jgi:hypothetical protein